MAERVNFSHENYYHLTWVTQTNPAYNKACLLYRLYVTPRQSEYLATSPSSFAKLRTVLIVEQASSATLFASARLSWTLVVSSWEEKAD